MVDCHDDNTCTNLDQQNNEPVNSNGFCSPPTIYQILPILYTFVSLVSFFLCLFSKVMISNPLLVILVTIAIAIILVCILYLWYQTSVIDPTDHIQVLHKRCIREKLPFNHRKYKYFCKTCKTSVSNNAFHCRKCNRCVQIFDHHCKWLNNCIGAKNYVEFCMLVACCGLLEILKFAVNVYIFRIQFSEGTEHLDWIIYTNCVIGSLGIIPMIALLFLMGLHGYLICTKKATIQLILDHRRQNRIHPIKSDSGQVNGMSVQDETPNRFLQKNSMEKEQKSNFFFLKSNNDETNTVKPKQTQSKRSCSSDGTEKKVKPHRKFLTKLPPLDQPNIFK